VIAMDTSTRPRTRLVVGTGLLATLTAAVATTGVAALARAAGVDLEVPADGETIPLSGIAFVTVACSLVGVALAAALHRWSPRPARWFLRTTAPLTLLSLVPPLVSGAAAATAATLVVLHLVAAAVVIPVLARSLGPLGASYTDVQFEDAARGRAPDHV
jgi:hypothetical protein